MALAETRQLDLVLNLKDQATKNLSAFSGKLSDLEPAFQKMSIAGGAMLAGIGFGVKSAVDQAVNLGESVNAVEVVFGEGSKNILAFGETASKSIGMANSEFNQMATITGALLKDTGKPMEEVADLTVDLTKRASDMASVFNTDVDDAMSAINQAIRGETEAIRRYAGDVTDATLQTYLQSKGIDKNVSKLTEQEKRLYRVDLIMEQTAVTAGDFQNTSDSLANQQRILGAEFKDISATLGETFIPMITDVLATVTPLIGQFATWAEENPELSKNIILLSAAGAGLITVIGGVGLVLPSVISGVGLLKTALASPVGLIAVFGILSAVAIAGAVEAWKELKDVQDEIKKSLQETNEQVDIARQRLGDMSTEANNVNLQNAINQYDELADEAERLANLGFIGSMWEGIKDTNLSFGKKIGAVNDAIISPNGNVITTHPDDYLIATKDPQSLSGGGGVSVNINGGMYLDRNAGDKLADVISDSLRRKLRI